MPRELIEPKGDKRFVRRGKRGRFKESDGVGRSLASDRRKKAKKVAKKGEGDKGDRPARKKTKKTKKKRKTKSKTVLRRLLARFV